MITKTARLSLITISEAVLKSLALGMVSDFVGCARGSLSDCAWAAATLVAPVAIIRGEWDSLASDADARWLFDALSSAALKRDVKIAEGTHLMHLEESRYALYRAAESFLRGDDAPPPAGASR